MEARGLVFPRKFSDKRPAEFVVRQSTIKERTAVKLSKKMWNRGLAALVASTCAVIGLSQVSTSAAPTITLTEEDYFNTVGQDAALAAYSKQFEAAHPGVTVTREYVPFASLDTKLLTQAAGHDLPNLLAVDNPFVSTMITTGQVVPVSGFMRLQHPGLFPGRDRRRPVQRQVLQPAGGGLQLDRVDLQHRHAEGGATSRLRLRGRSWSPTPRL